MKRSHILGLTLFLFLCAFACAADTYRDGYLLVRFTEEGASASADTARAAVVQAAGGGTIEKTYTIVPGLGLVKLPQGMTVSQAVAAFSATSGVRYAEADYQWQVQAVPNDPRFPDLWGMNNTGQTGGTVDADIDAPEAWDITTGSQGIIVAVIDTGVDYTHPDLANNMWVNEDELNGQDGVDDDGNGYVDDIYGYDFVNDDGDPMDDHYHGTHCAGTIGGIGDNGEGVAGVCWNVRIMALKFLSASGGGFTDDAIGCIEYAVQMGATLTSNSWGGGGYSQALYDAIAAAGIKNQLFVAAAGNDGMDNDQYPFYPAGYDLDNIISVLATDDRDTLASFSNRGKTTVDIGSPGVDIYSCEPGGGYQYLDGTSMACPHVAGAAALFLSLTPTTPYAEVKQAILASSDKLSVLSDKCVSGGRLNLYKLVLLAGQSDALPPLPDPAQLLIKPTATGLHQIAMQAVKATDKSGVEYRFDCIENNAYDSGWQSSAVYVRSDYPEGVTYSFRVQARDKSDNLNQTQWSETVSTTTATGVDNLPPAPSPTVWAAFPRVTRPSLNEIGMQVVTSYDENGVEYYFDCVLSNDPLWIADNTKYDSGWRTSPIYTVPVGNVMAYEYNFVAKVRQFGTTDPIYETIPTDGSQGKVGTAGQMVREVPSSAYRTIQDAIDAANSGDTVLVHQGVYREINIDFKGKAITVRSEDPENPAIVAATVVDCLEVIHPQQTTSWAHEDRRAFLFQHMEGRNSVLAGLTIRNATAFDEADSEVSYGWFSGSNDTGDPDQGDRYSGAETYDGEDAAGGAILIGLYRTTYSIVIDPITGDYKYNRRIITGNPASPTIRNCVFQDCSANGEYGALTSDAPGVPNDTPGNHGDRGLNGGNAYGGAIYAVSGSAPLLKECQFTRCQAVGGNGSNGSNGSNGGGHSNGVTDADGWRGGDGGDAGLGGCAWGGAIYFEPNCLPELYDVTVSDCFVQVGQPGHGGNGGNGSDAKGTGRGGHGGNGGLGGDLCAPDSSGGAVYYGKNTIAAIDGCRFENCRVIAELTGDYSGGNGGNGGNAAGGGQSGGDGGHGGPAYYIPDKMFDIGGATATGGTGGNGGGGSFGGPGGSCGYGGFRDGTYGAPCGGQRGDTGIFPSNMYYMAYYWEDTANILNPTNDPNDYLLSGYTFAWEREPIEVSHEMINYYTDPNDPNTLVGTYERVGNETVYMVVSRYSPFYALVGETEYSDPTITVSPDPNNPGQFIFEADYDNLIPVSIAARLITPLTPTDPNQPSAGACAGANYYGENCQITMRDTTVSNNTSFSNHAGGELYDKGCRATFDNCVYEGNTTLYETLVETDYKFEGYGGGIFADQPESMIFNDCRFSDNNAYAGGAIYCNFGPSDPNSQLDPADPNYAEPSRFDLTGCTFSGNRADYHFMYSYGGAVFAGNSLHPYEEYYFNYFVNSTDSGIFITSVYPDEHGFYNPYYPARTSLWNDELEADHILNGFQTPQYSVEVTECDFVENLSPYGAGLYLDASNVDITGSQFGSNIAQVGAGGFLFACDITAQNNNFDHNIGREITSQGDFSEAENATVSIVGEAPGLYLSNSDSFLINNRFIANEADSYAGALYINGLSPSGYPQSVFNNLFVENTAGLAGGALVADGGTDVEVLNCTFVENAVTDSYYGYGGGITAHDAYMSITNTILWDNQATLGPQLCIGDPLELLQVYDPYFIPATTVYLDFSDSQGGQDDIFIDENGWPWLAYGANNVEDNPNTLDDPRTPQVENDESDPLFAAISEPNNATGRTFYLSEIVAGQLSDSPCINAGTPAHFIYDPNIGDFINVPDVIGWLQDKLAFDVTTRTDHVVDSDPVNMGYHYDASLPVREYTLTAGVNIVDRFRHGELEVLTPSLTDPVQLPDDPNTATFKYTFNQGTIVQLLAKPEPKTPSDPNSIYRVGRWIGTDNVRFYYDQTNTVTMSSNQNVQVQFELAVPKNLYVPSAYETIEDAVLASRSGDRIILEPRPNEPYRILDPDGINFGGKQLVVTSLDPDDPEIVASTIIDCGGTRSQSKRAFHFESGEDPNSIIQGITIRNAFTAVIGDSGVVAEEDRWPWWDGPDPEAWTVDPPKPDPLPPFRALSGEDASGDSYGGAILIENGSSPVIRNCIFEKCTVAGGVGGDGDDGDYPTGMTDVTADLDSQSGGHGGNGSGNGYGGAIAIRLGSGSFATPSNPTIVNCMFIDNRATGGWGGIPGDAGTPYNAGRYGWGGDAGNASGDGRGGAIFVGVGCNPTISDCAFEGNFAESGQVSSGGTGSLTGEEYPEPYAADPWALAALRQGSDGVVSTQGTMAGGAVFFEQDADSVLKDCVFNDNMAPIGGAIYADTDVTLLIQRCEFTNHVGGALFTNSGPDLTILDSQFSNNDANQLSTGVGGAVTIGIEAISASIIDCNFVGNSTISDGGAILTHSDLTLEGCQFTENIASSDGGALYAYYVPDPDVSTLRVDIRDCEFRGNEAQAYGGAGFVKNAVLTVTDSRFIYNTAAGGGALRVPLSDLTMQRCMVLANEAVGTASGADGFGGGVHVIDGPFVITDSRFELNKSSVWGGAGGGLCVTGGQVYYDQNLSGSLFAKNSSKGRGGAIACVQSVSLEVDNCTIANNISVSNQGGGIYADYYSSVLLNNSIASGNAGYGIYQKANAESSADNTLFYSNLGGDLYNGDLNQEISGAADLMALSGYTNIFDTDPGFTAGPWGVYYQDAVDRGYHYPDPVGQPEYTLTASVINDRRGEVTINPDDAAYIPYAVVELNAIPDPNYQVYRWFGTDNDDSKQVFNGVLMVEDRIVKVEFEGAGPKKRYVPGVYPTIDEAMVVARSGDTIVLAPRPDQPYTITSPDGINFGGKQLIFTSTDPDDPEVRDSTILDCQGSRYTSKRAFHFESGEGADSIIQGITIRNAFTAVIGASRAISTGRWPWHDGPLDPLTDPWVDDEEAPNPDPLPPLRALSGEDAIGDSYGGAILVENGSSPTIYNCVFEKCTVSGGIGGDGENGDYPANYEDRGEDLDSQSGGHSGMGEGDGYGGAIAVRSGSSPKILNCQFKENRATGGWGGIPGNAGLSYNGGRWGWGGNDSAGLSYAERYTEEMIAGYQELGVIVDGDLLQMNDWLNAGNGFGDGHGGAIYVEAGCNPMIADCNFVDNYARSGYVSAGGRAADGAPYPEPFDPARPPVAWGEQGQRDGMNGILTDNGTIAGGAVFFGEDANSMLIDCVFSNNSAYDVTTGTVISSSGTTETFGEASTYTRGGAVQIDTGATVKIVDCNFVENIGGAVFSSTGASLTLDRCNFRNNSTVDLNADPTSVSSSLVTVLNNLVTDTGTTITVISDELVEVLNRDIAGAVTIDFDPAVPADVNNCTFTGNQTDASGGAILANGDVKVTNSVFNANIATGNGGAFYSYYETSDPNWLTIKLSFEDCEFNANKSEQGIGGAGYVKTAVLDMDDCYFVNNKAASGGGLYAALSDLRMKGLLLYGNEATGIDAGSHRTIVGEGYGGGIFISDGPFTITDTRFVNNISRSKIGAGAGLCVSGAQPYQQHDLWNCLFGDNLSENVGGGIACQQGVNLTLNSCTIANNTSGSQQGGGIFVSHDCGVSLHNSIVSENEGYGIYEKRSSNGSYTGVSDADYTLFYGNTLGDLYDAQTAQSVSGVANLRSIGGYGINGVEDIIEGDPQYADGPYDGYYLSQSEPTSPAINAGSTTPKAALLYDASGKLEYTTDPAYPADPNNSNVIRDGGPDGESNWVDLGYHYYIPNSKDDKFTLTAFVQDGGGEVGILDNATGKIKAQVEEPYYRGKIIDLTAKLDTQYFLTGWSGGTIDDNSRDSENVVLITRDKTIKVKTRLRRTLNVGTSTEYDTLGDALDDARDGDIIFIAPGRYTAASQFPSSLNEITLESKEVTISGANPDDESVVRATVFNNFSFYLAGLNEKTVIEGITLESSTTDLFQADLIIRNCVFTDCRFTRTHVYHGPPVAGGTDGYTQRAIMGGAIRMYDSSPKILNSIFENNSVTGAYGENGFAGDNGHPNGGDGGWPSKVYGGAVYCGMSSEPNFIGCTFTGNEVFGADGGNGADFVTINNESYYGGRGGGWVYDDVLENYLIESYDWDGWTFESYGDKYYDDSTSFSYPYIYFYGEYDLDQWAEWFNWNIDGIDTWEDFLASPPDDPHDKLMDPWRYSGYGGAVYCEVDSDATFKDCVFENNQSHGGLTGVGGAHPEDMVRWPDRQLNMPTAGGAVFAAIDSDLTFENCVFRNNVADTSTVDLPHTFQVSFGGAVAYEFGCNATFKDCDVKQNTATVGGGIYGFDSTVTVDSSTISGNEAFLGAGMYSDDKAATVTATTFESNRAKKPDVVIEPPADGGQQQGDEPVVAASTLDLTGEGGGFYAHDQKLKLRDSVFIKNTAAISGGGLDLSGTVDKQADIFNCLFAENTAGRDGGGASVNWWSRAAFGNCTFDNNSGLGIIRYVETGEFDQALDPDTLEPLVDDQGNPILIPHVEPVQDLSFGGGLAISYDSIVDVNDSIFWGNGAAQGTSIYVSGNSESLPRPSELTISYSIIANYPSANAIYAEPGSTLNKVFGITSDDPLFVALPGAAEDDIAAGYYLDQSLSPCIDTGSGFASDLGSPVTLSNYTTSITGALDKGKVDLGFHYTQAVKMFCQLADLELSGTIDLSDLAVFMSEWLSGPCGIANSWCNKADLNTDTLVNIEDFADFASCWADHDNEAPLPNPAEWQLDPNAVPGTFDMIEMAAVVHHDNWWPDEDIKYRFYTVSAEDPDPNLFYVDQDRLNNGVYHGNNDGWLTYDELGPESKDEIGNLVRIYATRTELKPIAITLFVQAVDGSGNETDFTDDDGKIVTPGGNFGLPPAQWLNPPFVKDDQFAIQMEAVEYTGPLPDGYAVWYNFINTSSNGTTSDWQPEPVYVDDIDIVEGQTYTYRVQMMLFHLDQRVEGSEGELSAEASVVAVLPDLIPPTPNPAEHDATRFSPFAQSEDGVFYQYVIAVEATDDSDVEYKFVCNNNPTRSSGQPGNGPEWRNADNVGLGVDALPGDVSYPNPTGGIQVPYEYHVRTNTKESTNTWYIITRDRVPQHNRTWAPDYLPDPTNPQYQAILDAVNAQVLPIQN